MTVKEKKKKIIKNMINEHTKYPLSNITDKLN